MEHLINDLISILEKETSLYEDLLRVLRKERELIASFDVDRLTGIVRRKVELIDDLRKLEEDRKAIAGVLGDRFNIRDLEFTISHLIQNSDVSSSAKLKNCANRLSSIVSEVSRFNKDNGILIERSLKYINDSVRILSSLVEERHTYSPSPTGISLENNQFGRIVSAEA
jgi:flagellar biosynthesis/type III secretory pathway chaperone